MTNIEKFWLNVSGYYRQQLPDPILKMYVYDCQGLQLDDLRKAFETYRRGAKAEFFPLPAVLKNIINPPPIDRDWETYIFKIGSGSSWR